MPVYDLGYRTWNERRTPPRLQWYVIASTGVALAWKSRWLRRLMLLAWIPATYLGVGIFAFEKAVEYREWRGPIQGIMNAIPQSNQIPLLAESAFSNDLQELRYKVWRLLLLTFFRYPQSVVMILLVGLIIPPLISGDLRSRAHLLYFSRPLTIRAYLLGRMTTVWAYLAMITAVPALFLYVIGVLLSNDVRVVYDTWDLPPRIVAATAVLLVPTCALAMCVSSLFTENRNAMFAWFAIWILGWVAYANVTVAHVVGHSGARPDWPTFLSLYHVMGTVQSWVFGLEDTSPQLWTKIGLLVAITVGACMIMIQRISAPLRV